MSNKFEVIEIYPKILVYRNVFKDPQKIYDIIKESAEQNEDRLLSKWSQWSIFGDYLNPTAPGITPIFSLAEVDELNADTEIKQNQKLFLRELFENFYKVSEDYTNRFKDELDFDINELSDAKDENGNYIPRWQAYGPSIAKYHKDPENFTQGHGGRTGMAMTYHSDYIREPIVSPGYKFAITVLSYFNDDYKGGEIDFAIGKELYSYKPKAGDWLVFPSGHPDVLNKDGMVYLHGVLEPSEEHKYFARMYWRRYSEGDQEWFDKENEFGKETWLSMQEGIMEQYRLDHPQRYEIPEGVRINESAK